MLFILSAIVHILLTFITYVFILLVLSLISLKIYNIMTRGKCKSKARLDGKIVLITGGNSGIGLETARDLARRGAKVIIASRNVEKSAKAVADIIATTGNRDIEYKYLDLAKFTSIRKFAEEFNKSYSRLDILVNNSGTGGLKHRLTEDGIDVVTQINYFGPFLLTNLLLDKVIASKPSRVVIVSSLAHIFAKLDLEDLKCEIEKSWYSIYANTKLLNVLWAKALAKRMPDGVTVNVLHPGVVKTDIFNKLSPIMTKVVQAFIGAIYKSAEEGAQTSIYLAVADEVENISGKYFTDCTIAAEAKIAQNEDLIDQVWEKSLLITNE